jgi:hypothetical protein
MTRMPRVRTVLLLAAVVAAVIAGFLVFAPHRLARAEQYDCTAVAEFSGGNPWHKPGFVMREVRNPWQSGNGNFDAATRRLAADLRRNDGYQTSLDVNRVRSICIALGMWQPRH